MRNPLQSSEGQIPDLNEGTAVTDTSVACLCRPTMILYGIDNIRDLFGHKVSVLDVSAVSLPTYHHHLGLIVAG